jgi:hypothetical protein
MGKVKTTTAKAVIQNELRIAKQPAGDEPDWIKDIRGRLPTTWARTVTVAIALDLSCLTILELCEAEEIVGIDYSKGEKSAWLIYVPSVIEFLRRRQGGRHK